MQEKISNYIKRIRKEAGLNTKAFGETIGKSAKTIENWEQGLYKPKPATFNFIERIYGVMR